MLNLIENYMIQNALHIKIFFLAFQMGSQTKKNYRLRNIFSPAVGDFICEKLDLC